MASPPWYAEADHLIHLQQTQSTRSIVMVSLSKPGTASAHDLALANQFRIKLGSIERQINVKVHAVECSLRCIHAFEVFFEILS